LFLISLKLNKVINSSIIIFDDGFFGHTTFDIIPCFLDESKPPKMKMECMGEYRFNGTLIAMEPMALSLARDALLLAFSDAKLAIVEYDPDTHDLRTISVHYFETEDLKVGVGTKVLGRGV
jgi:hypothetical protein